jgi:hypothetical protein
VAVVAKGVDYAFSHPSLPSMKANGISFACRYLYPFSQTPGTKNLTQVEADVLNTELEHGVVSNFESWASRALDGFAAGIADANQANAQHLACGGPATRPIYFSIDFDPTPDQYPAIEAYMRGVASVIGLYRTGAYGSYAVIKHLFDTGLITWGWQTYAWSHGMFDERSQLAQDQNGVAMGGAEVDLDTAHAEDFGQWNYKAGSDELSSAEADRIIARIDKLEATMNHSHLLAYRGDTDAKGQAKPPGQNTHPSNTEFIYRAITQGMRLVKEPTRAAVYLGDHMIRRWIDDPAELAKLQEHLRNAALDPNIYTLAPGEQLDTWGLLRGKDPYPPKPPTTTTLSDVERGEEQLS